VASSKRERELARMRLERQQARRAAAEARRKQRQRTLLAVVAAVAVAAVAVTLVLVSGGDDKKKPTQTLNSSTKFGNTGGSFTCSYKASDGAAKKVDGLPPSTGVKNTGTGHAVITTNQGTLEADLLTAKAPCTVNSFYFLGQQSYFDSTSCHRLTTSGIYVLQCGDPTATGSGGPGYLYADENLTGATYPAGTLAMANSGPGTNGSQFFIVYKDTQLPPSYTPFGKVTKGLDVVLKVAKAGTDNGQGDGKPKTPVTITKVALT
jgi:peptidyl-prolyl cis-trans isomerase B (cyclophilin B)